MAQLSSTPFDRLQRSTQDITYYVETTGDDDANGITAATPLATIQEAINRIPKYNSNTYQINVGDGNFQGALIDGVTFDSSGSLTITGELGAPTLTGGTASGTADSGDTDTVGDSGQAWTVNELRGMLVLVDGEYRHIRSNDATSMELVDDLSGASNGKAYSIVEQKTIINSADPVEGTSGLSIKNSDVPRNAITVENIKTSGITFGFGCSRSVPLYYKNCNTTGGVVGFIWQVWYGEVEYENIYAESAVYGIYFLGESGGRVRDGSGAMAYNCSSEGITVYSANVIGQGTGFVADACAIGLYATYCSLVSFPKFRSDSCTDRGVRAIACNYLDFDDELSITNATNSGLYIKSVLSVDIDGGTISDNGSYGILIDEVAAGVGTRTGSSSIDIAAATISDNGASGICAQFGSCVSLDDVTGTGNTGYGLELTNGSRAIITGDTDVTGTTGDATIDEGATTLVWATDFASDDDKRFDSGFATYIRRKD